MPHDVEAPELKPCPFCGGEAEAYSDGECWHGFCRSCFSQCGEEPSQTEAIAAWNTRTALAEAERAAAVKAERERYSAAARDVLAERARQVSDECWTAEHDDAHTYGELADAASCYATDYGTVYRTHPPKKWPWAAGWWKPKDRRRNLVRAGALIIAEIERLDRAAICEGRE